MATPWNELVRLENSVKHPQLAQTRRRCPPYIALRLEVVRRVHVLFSSSSPSSASASSVLLGTSHFDATMTNAVGVPPGPPLIPPARFDMFSPCARKEGSRGGWGGRRPSERNSVCDMGKQEQYPMTCGGVTTISLKLKLYRRSLPPKGKTGNVPIYRLPSFSRAVL